MFINILKIWLSGILYYSIQLHILFLQLFIIVAFKYDKFKQIRQNIILSVNWPQI